MSTPSIINNLIYSTLINRNKRKKLQIEFQIFLGIILPAFDLDQSTLCIHFFSGSFFFLLFALLPYIMIYRTQKKLKCFICFILCVMLRAASSVPQNQKQTFFFFFSFGIKSDAFSCEKEKRTRRRFISKILQPIFENTSKLFKLLCVYIFSTQIIYIKGRFLHLQYT